MQDIKQKFNDKKKELKDWLYGTVYKGYDTEECAEVVQQDVDDFFTDKFIDELLALAVEQEKAKLLKKLENHEKQNKYG